MLRASHSSAFRFSKFLFLSFSSGNGLSLSRTRVMVYDMYPILPTLIAFRHMPLDYRNAQLCIGVDFSLNSFDSFCMEHRTQTDDDKNCLFLYERTSNGTNWK